MNSKRNDFQEEEKLLMVGLIKENYTLVKLNLKMIPTLLNTDEPGSWRLPNSDGCAHCTSMCYLQTRSFLCGRDQPAFLAKLLP